jgi:CheY-like chemotaxis protein
MPIAQPEWTGKTLLVVEDDDATRAGLATLLRWAGYAVITVANGQAALDYLRLPPGPDLILLDMMMPVLDGWQFLARRKVLGPPAAEVPVIIVTSESTTRAWAESQGCAGFMGKPVEAASLLGEIHRILGTGPRPG